MELSPDEIWNNAYLTNPEDAGRCVDCDEYTLGFVEGEPICQPCWLRRHGIEMILAIQ